MARSAAPDAKPAVGIAALSVAAAGAPTAVARAAILAKNRRRDIAVEPQTRKKIYKNAT